MKRKNVYTKKAVKAANKRKKENALFRKYKYKADRLLRSGIAKGAFSVRGKVSMAEFKQQFSSFQRLAPNGQRLETTLREFVDFNIKRFDPSSSKSARANLINHAKEMVKNFNKVGLDGLGEYDQKLYNVMKKYMVKDEKGKYKLDTSKLPDSKEFYDVSSGYLRLKRALAEEFGDEYENAFGS